MVKFPRTGGQDLSPIKLSSSICWPLVTPTKFRPFRVNILQFGSFNDQCYNFGINCKIFNWSQLNSWVFNGRIWSANWWINVAQPTHTQVHITTHPNFTLPTLPNFTLPTNPSFAQVSCLLIRFYPGMLLWVKTVKSLLLFLSLFPALICQQKDISLGILVPWTGSSWDEGPRWALSFIQSLFSL